MPPTLRPVLRAARRVIAARLADRRSIDGMTDPATSTAPTSTAPTTSGPTTSRPSGSPSAPWAVPDLPKEDAERIDAALAAARTASTRTVYASLWSRWERWCVERDLCALPGAPATLAAYLADRAAAGMSVVSLNVACSAIRHQHRRHRLPDPTADETVRQVRRGLARSYGTAPRRQARPLDAEEIRRIVGHIDTATPRVRAKGIRDTALILLG